MMVYNFPAFISLKVNLKEQLEFELTHSLRDRSPAH